MPDNYYLLARMSEYSYNPRYTDIVIIRAKKTAKSYKTSQGYLYKRSRHVELGVYDTRKNAVAAYQELIEPLGIKDYEDAQKAYEDAKTNLHRKIKAYVEGLS